MAPQQAEATHFAGADVSYQCLDDGRYVITFNLYRDCDGAGMPTTLPLSISSDSCGLSIPGVSLPRDTFYEVSQLCPSVINQSTCNGGTLPGYEVYVYSDTISFPQTCEDWVISWTSCCRNGTITTGADNESIIVSAMLDNNYCNDSPVFNSLPVPYFCAGQQYNYNHGANDPENDTLIYALTCPNTIALNTCVPYLPGLSPTQPIYTSPANTFGFNTNTGQMTFTPQTGTPQIGVAGVTVYNILNGDTIGFVQRDIQMVVLDDVNCTSPISSNTPSVIAGGSFDTTASSFVVCAGQSLQFSVVLVDPDGDTIAVDPANTNLDRVFGVGNWSITIVNSAPSPYRPDSALLLIQISAVPNNIGVNQFTIGTTDNSCPIPGNQILSYNLIIPGVEVTARDTIVCPGIAQQIQMTANSFSSIGGSFTGSYQWTRLSGVPVTFSNDTILNPLVSAPASTVDGDSVTLELSFTTVPDPNTGAQCVTTDSVTIRFRALPLTLFAFTSDTSLCPNFTQDTITTQTAVFGPGIDLVNGVYSWSASPANYLDSLSNTNTNNPDIISSGGPGDTAVYTVSYTYGACTGSDDILIYWREGIPDVTASADTVCPGDTIQLNAVLTDTITRPNPIACRTYTADAIPHAPLPIVGSTTLNLGDDDFSAAIPIGFPFEFYCQTKTQLVVSSNGYITFDLTQANGFSTAFTGAIPNAFSINDLIALVFDDLDPNNGTTGTIEYFNVGTAPNRKFVISYTNVDRFGGGDAVTGQIILSEGTNEIEIHSTNIPQDGTATQGIENSTGTIGVPTPGRNATTWSATNDAYRFTPQAPLIFTPITYNWIPGFAVSNATIPNPTSIIQGTTTYIAQITQGDCMLEDSVEVAVRSTIPAPTLSCGTPANQATTVLFEWGMSPGATGWEYSLDSGLTWIPRPIADSSLLITGLTNGDCANILVRATGGAGLCPTNSATYLECCTTPCPPPNTTLTTNLNCNGSSDGTINIGIAGGVLGYHPNFDVTLFDTSGAVIGNQATADTARFTGLAADVYYAYIIDTLGCFTYSDTVTLTQPDTLILNLDSTTLTTCFADTDGTAAVFATGGTAGYSFQWPASAANQTGMMATGLGRGIYDVVLTDTRGCTDTLAVRVNSPFPALPAVTLNTTNSTSCSGSGTASIFTTTNMVGTAPSFTYQWSAGTPNGFNVTDLPSGTHSVTVTDNNGCEAIETFTITGSPTIAITNFVTTNPGCNIADGAATVVATGDSTGYIYAWDTNAASQTTITATGLGIGTYVVTVTGASNGCTVIDSVTLVNTASVDIVGLNVTQPTCGGNDGVITVQSVGATGAITYNWSNGGTSQTISNLAVGSYAVTVTDAANCSDIADTILVQPTITATITDINDPNCNLTNGNLTVGVTGAIGPFSYNWSNGATSAIAQGLGAGNYTVTATYQGCTATASGILTAQSLQIAITDKDDISCNGDGDAYAYVQTTNNSSPVTYQWTGPNGFTSSNDSIMNLAAGNYTVVASLAGGCSVTQSINVVDVTLSANAWVVAPGQKTATIQINDQADLNAGVVTNHFNPTFSWTEENPGVVTIDDMTDTATFVTGQTATSNSSTWLYFTATAGPCTVMDSVLVEVQSYLGMPTAFTPNGDGINDLFRPAGLQSYEKVFKFEIYNRFGQLVYSNAANPQWDGTLNGVAQPRDVYIYVFEYATDAGEIIEVRGEFTLLR